jgi:serine/threonine protein kinase
MAVVHQAYDLELDDQVAIKILRPEVTRDRRRGPAELERFKREIKLARRILHTNVCRIYDYGHWQELQFVTMEIIPGRTLEEVLADPRVDGWGPRLDLFRGILAGVQAAHAMGIVHRDLKPLNIMVTREGRPVVMDFGIAQEISIPEEIVDGHVLGTPHYMAPERLLGRVTDHRCDIYSLGVLLFELLSGQRPFAGDSITEVALQQVSDPPPLPTAICPDIPSTLEQIILKMLEKKPESRYQSIGQILAELERSGLASDDPRAVLLVDDDPDLIRILESCLSREGLRVFTAENGGQGIKTLFRERVDLISVDLNMPIMDGFQFMSFLKENDLLDRVPVFMLTAEQDPRYEEQAARLGIERFFTKPLDAQRYAEQIQHRLRFID